MMKIVKNLTLSMALFALANSAFSYDVVDRFKLIDDKLKTEQMLRPIGHDFFFDVGVALNKDAKTFVNEISDVSKLPEASQLAEAQRVLNKYDKTEQTIKLNVALGFPIFSFSAWDVKVQPNFRVFVDAGANLGVRKDTLTAADVFSLINIDVPTEYKSYLIQAYDDAAVGADIMLSCPPGNAGVTAFCAANTGHYFKPDSSIPNLNLFAKIDGRVGLFNDYTYQEHYFGNWNLYALSRTDIAQTITYAAIASGAKVELPKKKNTEMSLQTDYRLGYKNDNYKVFAAIEEIKLVKIKKRDAESKELAYSYDPLMRLHADAMYKFSILSLNPFFGLHKRSGYGFADGIYAGADAGAHVWGDRLGLQLRGMVDKQYFTISPRMKLWLLQLEYSLKSPMKSMDGDVKLSALHSIDLRLFF